MSNELNGKRVAILVTNGFEQVEMTPAATALVDAGAEADVVSPRIGVSAMEPNTIGRGMIFPV